jgi:methyl-accepting chemotaxis protein
MGPILSGVRMLVSSFKQLFFELDTTASQFMTATGMNREFTMSLEGTARQLQRDAATTLPEYYAATQQMITGVTDFTMASRQQQETMAQTATMLERVGVSTQDFAAGAQNSIKMFSMSMNEASSFASELTQTAKALGVTPQQMASDFAQVGGSLAKLGSEGPRAFKELARVSKLTGLEISKLINLTSKFDTFEDAATMTGQLNAALGGNFVNAMDMMMTTDPVQRFEMLRDAISSTGLTFDEMSYYQRQFFANAMGLESVGDLALMMSGNMDLMSGATQQSAADYEKMAEEAAATADLQRLFNSVLAEMAPMMGEILIAVRDFMMGLKENEALLADIRNVFDGVGGVIKFVIENIEIMTIAFNVGG